MQAVRSRATEKKRHASKRHRQEQAAALLFSPRSLSFALSSLFSDLHGAEVHGVRDDLWIVHESKRLPVDWLEERVGVGTRLEELEDGVTLLQRLAQARNLRCAVG